MTSPRRVVIVGGSSAASEVARLVDDGYAAWGLNAVLSPFRLDRLNRQIAAARWFQIHPPWSCDPRELAWAAICPVPLYAIQHYDEWPSSIPYPLEDVLAIHGAAEAGFASTFAYAMALAIREGVDEVVLLGVRLDRGTLRERLVERPNLAWWAGLAAGFGMYVTYDVGAHPATPPGGYRYGWDYAEERTAVATWCRATQRVQQVDGEA